jgi:hypothetical protein
VFNREKSIGGGDKDTKKKKKKFSPLLFLNLYISDFYSLGLD